MLNRHQAYLSSNTELLRMIAKEVSRLPGEPNVLARSTGSLFSVLASQLNDPVLKSLADDIVEICEADKLPSVGSAVYFDVNGETIEGKVLAVKPGGIYKVTDTALSKVWTVGKDSVVAA